MKVYCETYERDLGKSFMKEVYKVYLWAWFWDEGELPQDDVYYQLPDSWIVI